MCVDNNKIFLLQNLLLHIVKHILSNNFADVPYLTHLSYILRAKLETRFAIRRKCNVLQSLLFLWKNENVYLVLTGS